MLALTLILSGAPALEDTAHQRAPDSCTSEKVAGGVEADDGAGRGSWKRALEKGAGGGRWKRELEKGVRRELEELMRARICEMQQERTVYPYTVLCSCVSRRIVQLGRNDHPRRTPRETPPANVNATNSSLAPQAEGQKQPFSPQSPKSLFCLQIPGWPNIVAVTIRPRGRSWSVHDLPSLPPLLMGDISSSLDFRNPSYI
jgi:hypothetical protein